MYIVADAHDLDTFAQDVIGEGDYLANKRQQFIDRLRTLDYDRVFGVVVFLGSSPRYTDITVLQVRRHGQTVRVWTAFTGPWLSRGRSAIITDPYQLVSVTKTGQWGQAVTFELVANGTVVAQTTQTIQ
jgi:hypothetical protein